MRGKVRVFRRRRLTQEEGRECAKRVLDTPIPERTEKAEALHLDDPEMLLSLLGELPKMWESAPAKVFEEAVFLYRHLEGIEVRYPADPMLYDEREYFLGEAARIAGTACRYLSRRDEARHWFDLSEAWFLATENSASNVARVTYSRLALRIDEHGDLASVLELIPHLVANFERLSMHEDALKARFLEATVMKEMGRPEEAIEPFHRVIEQASALRSYTVLASAYVNLTQIHCLLGDSEGATASAKEATLLLHRLGNHVSLAKLQFGVGFLLRAEGNLEGAIEAFRRAENEFAAIEMRADVAAVQLVLADLLLDAGEAARAEWEIRAALPIIDAYKLVPEGIAALSLLRESLRRRQIDRNALRELHGYFPDPRG